MGRERKAAKQKHTQLHQVSPSKCAAPKDSAYERRGLKYEHLQCPVTREVPDNSCVALNE
jgi:hypothetical protein